VGKPTVVLGGSKMKMEKKDSKKVKYIPPTLE